MKKYISVIYSPGKTFQELTESDDGRHGIRTNSIILLTILLPIGFSVIYDFLFPFDPNATNTLRSTKIFGFLFPAIFGTILGLTVFKYLIPFLIHAIGKNFSGKVDNIAQTRLVVAFSLIPILIISPLRTIYFIENQTILLMIDVLLKLASINSIVILFVGIKLIYDVENKQSILMISPFIILTIISFILGQ